MAVTKTTGTGISGTLNFEAALIAAVDDLGWQPKYPDEQAQAKVSDIHVEIGGFTGGRRLYVTVALDRTGR
ncbi:MAG: hypothetical protein E6I56_10735 [Chloroflexi bacterium]|nr:MAG: hypothetical protein E6I56_10735 [Chloroflexota bacterium]